jgi:hypothetical protein
MHSEHIGLCGEDYATTALNELALLTTLTIGFLLLLAAPWRRTTNALPAIYLGVLLAFLVKPLLYRWIQESERSGRCEITVARQLGETGAWWSNVRICMKVQLLGQAATTTQPFLQCTRKRILTYTIQSSNITEILLHSKFPCAISGEELWGEASPYIPCNRGTLLIRKLLFYTNMIIICAIYAPRY